MSPPSLVSLCPTSWQPQQVFPQASSKKIVIQVVPEYTYVSLAPLSSVDRHVVGLVRLSAFSAHSVSSTRVTLGFCRAHGSGIQRLDHQRPYIRLSPSRPFARQIALLTPSSLIQKSATLSDLQEQHEQRATDQPPMHRLLQTYVAVVQ